MGILGKLFGGDKKKDSEAQAQESIDCPHAMLVPRWETVQDMGHEDRATRYMCEGCHEEFTPEEAKKIQASIAERMAQSLEELREETEATSESRSN